MSVFRHKCVQCFVAPVAMGPDGISLAGSWIASRAGSEQELRMSPDRLCHYRLHCWKQQLSNTVIDACADVCVRKTLEGHRFEIELKFLTTESCNAVLEEVTPHIQDMLKRSNFWALVDFFQQEQPGTAVGVSGRGNAGNDGDIQSV